MARFAADSVSAVEFGKTGIFIAFALYSRGGENSLFRVELSQKVRDIYNINDNRLLIVTTDRISAFDYVFEDIIPGKGILLTKMTKFWFKLTNKIIDNIIKRSINCGALGSRLTGGGFGGFIISLIRKKNFNQWKSKMSNFYSKNFFLDNK